MKRLVMLAAVVGALAVPAAASAAPQDYFENPCGRPFTDIWTSYATGHSWIAQWTGTDVARGGPEDGVWRRYAAAWTAGYEDGWHFSYYYWTSCYV